MHKRGTRWAYVVDVGRDPPAGKRRQRTMRGFHAEADDALGELVGVVRAGTAVPPSSITLKQYLDEGS